MLYLLLLILHFINCSHSNDVHENVIIYVLLGCVLATYNMPSSVHAVHRQGAQGAQLEKGTHAIQP